MSQVLLAQANALQLPLRDASVHCVVTSVPYWGLRDYGTATWHGGEPACTHHKGEPIKQDTRSTLVGTTTTQNHSQESWGDVCRKCGAARVDKQLGLEPRHDCLGWATGAACGACWVCHMVDVFREVKRVLRPDGTLWLNCGDTYSSGGRVGHGTRQGYKQQTNRGMNGTNDPPRAPQPAGLRDKNLLGMPWRLALALQADGWYLRSDIIWNKPNCMPGSQQDRPTMQHEYVFLLSKQQRYFFDPDAIREPYATDDASRSVWVKGWATDGEHTAVAHNQAKNHQGSKFTTGKTGINSQGRGAAEVRDDHPSGRMARTVWTIPTQPFPDAHFATFAPALVERCILAGTSAHGVCPQCGAPWRRIVERQRLLDGTTPVTGTFARPDEPFRIPPNGVGHWRYTTQTTAHGWHATCACEAGPLAPATVLDPFCGSGTTALVARALGRHAIGLDLSWPYLHNIARKRLGIEALAAWEGRNGHTPAIDYSALPLFGAQP